MKRRQNSCEICLINITLAHFDNKLDSNIAVFFVLSLWPCWNCNNNDNLSQGGFYKD